MSDSPTPTCAVIAAPADRALAERLARVIEECGLTAVLLQFPEKATSRPMPGTAYFIDESRFVLLVVSAAAERSPHFHGLVKYAFSTKKMLLPYKICPGKLRHGLHLMLGQHHWLDVSESANPESGIPELRRVAETHRRAFEAERRLEKDARRRNLVFAAKIFGIPALTVAAALALFALSVQAIRLTRDLARIAAGRSSSAAVAERVCGNADRRLPDISMVSVPAGWLNGEFFRPFKIGRCEITQEQFFAVTGKKPSFFKGENLPVDSVSWNDAKDFCRKLTELAKTRGEGLRGRFDLPTAEQWEYACRAGTATRYCSGDSEVDLFRVGWYQARDRDVSTHPVGQKAPNAFGIRDMHGNVHEWCRDDSREDSQPFRGGSAASSPADCASDSLGFAPKNFKSATIGFRVALIDE